MKRTYSPEMGTSECRHCGQCGLESGEPYRKMDAGGDRFLDEATAWVDENYPNWRDPRCYWKAD